VVKTERNAFDLVTGAFAVLLAVSLVVSALHDVSQAYDVWYYHLPFAARLAGILSPDAYTFGADNLARFEGFPLFGELLQGWLWRITGHIQATNLVAVGALLALPVYLWRSFRVPPAIALIAFLAIPLVQVHATSSYVDLPANAWTTMLLLEVHRAFVANEAPTPARLAWSALVAGAVVNTKFQLVPIVVAACVALVFLSLRDLRRWREMPSDARSSLKRRALILGLALPIVFATPIKNVVVHGNPVWPIELRVLGHELPYVEKAYGSSPHHLEEAARPVRFLRSVLEWDNRPISSHRRWSIDQWTPPDEPGYRMGGFFGAYVVVNLVGLAFAVWRKRSREALVAASVVAGATVIASVVPQSHELRYYLFSMLLLVAMNLVLWAREARWAVFSTALAAFAIVAWSTDGGYLYASGMSFPEFLAKRVDASIIESTRPNERICVAGQPFTFLYAPIFHPARAYRVKEAASDTDCSSVVGEAQR
jgi:hypothetical protein